MSVEELHEWREALRIALDETDDAEGVWFLRQWFWEVSSEVMRSVAESR